MPRPAPSKMETYLDARHTAERRDLLVRVLASAAAIVLIAAAGMLVAPMNQIRLDANIVVPSKPASMAELSPGIALLTKTGTFRALAIDLAFIRAEEMKQQGRFYELMQLSNWLCDLAPRYPRVWQYSAWNMAYNISVCEYTPEARWLWVMNGINSLRNHGLVYNPKSISLYKELAWIFYHKIGDKLDDFHIQYKRELAVEMELLFGEPPLALTKEDSLKTMRAIAEAPDDLEAWIDATPEAAQLVAALAEVDLAADATLLHFVAKNMRSYSDVTAYTIDEPEDESASLMQRRRTLLSDPKRADTVATLLAAIRKSVLRNKYNMHPEYMFSLMQCPEWMEGEDDTILPLDWRLPASHSLYWASYGDMMCTGAYNIDDADSMNTVRLIFFSLTNMVRGGRLTLEPNFQKPNQSFIQMLPDTRYIKPMHYAYLYFGKKQFGDDERFVEGTSGPNYFPGHRNFLLDSIRELYLEGGERNIEEAKQYYFYLRNFDRDENGGVKPKYVVTFDRFVLNNIKESLETQHGATAFISSLLHRSLKEAMDGQIDQSVGHFKEAQHWWDYYMRDIGTDRNARRKLEPLGVMRRDVAKQMLIAGAGGYSAVQKARLWKALDIATRRAIYDEVLPWIEAQCKAYQPPLDPAKVLRIPPGMEEYRKNPDDVLEELERFDPGVSQGEKIIVE